MDLGKDAFTITYNPSKVTVVAISKKIRGLGYRPEEAPAKEPDEPDEGTPPEAIPEPVADALAEAEKAGQLLLVDFYAAWCGPCKLLDGEILVDPQVQKALEGYTFLKVDTDQFVKPSERFQVFVLPTLLVLDSKGTERYRHVGIIDAETLAQKLASLASGDGG